MLGNGDALLPLQNANADQQYQAAQDLPQPHCHVTQTPGFTGRDAAPLSKSCKRARRTPILHP